MNYLLRDWDFTALHVFPAIHICASCDLCFWVLRIEYQYEQCLLLFVLHKFMSVWVCACVYVSVCVYVRLSNIFWAWQNSRLQEKIVCMDEWHLRFLTNKYKWVNVCVSFTTVGAQVLNVRKCFSSLEDVFVLINVFLWCIMSY